MLRVHGAKIVVGPPPESKQTAKETGEKRQAEAPATDTKQGEKQ